MSHPIPKVSASKYETNVTLLPTPRRGLGDIIALVTVPAARLLDHHLGTNLEHCPGCAARRQALNTIFPATISPSPGPAPAAT